MGINSFVIVVLSALLTWLVVLVTLPFLQNSLADRPNSRSSHTTSTPRGGGTSFILVVCIISFVQLSMGSCNFASACIIPLLLIPLAVTGLLDDKIDLEPRWRYCVQFLTSLGLIRVSELVRRLTLHSDHMVLIFLSYAIIVVIITAIINFSNFSDGLDGLLSGCMIIVFIGMAIKQPQSIQMWSLVGALLGFLIWNWSPAKVFMGDSGSTYLGATLAAYILQQHSWGQALGLLLTAMPLMGDCSITILRRMGNKQNIFTAHRLHLYQRLHQAGWSHAKVSGVYISSTIVLVCSNLIGGLGLVIGMALIELLYGYWLDRFVAIPFAMSNRSS